MGRSLTIFDTTLRDGEQMPHVVFSKEQKVELALLFSEFGVDYIDIMPFISPHELEVTRELARLDMSAEIVASCRMMRKDIDTVHRCGVRRICLFTPLSDLHLERKLGITKERNLERSLEMIDYARRKDLAIDFAAEDCSRADKDYLMRFIDRVSDKVGTFFLADTTGCKTPSETFDIVKAITGRCGCRIGLHEHNDFGLATANTLEGIRAGAEVFSGTFTGIGERAGNAPIEEVCAALKFIDGVELPVKYHLLKDICDRVQAFSGIRLHPHKPVTGENAFSHEAGIHVQGILTDALMYENFDPAFVGHERRIWFGKHSGKAGLSHFIDDAPDDEIQMLLEAIKEMSQAQGRSFSSSEVIELHRSRSRANRMTRQEGLNVGRKYMLRGAHLKGLHSVGNMRGVPSDILGTRALEPFEFTRF